MLWGLALISRKSDVTSPHQYLSITVQFRMPIPICTPEVVALRKTDNDLANDPTKQAK